MFKFSFNYNLSFLTFKAFFVNKTHILFAFYLKISELYIF